MSGRPIWEPGDRARVVGIPPLPRGSSPGTVEASGQAPIPPRGDPVRERAHSPKLSRGAEQNKAESPGGAEPPSRLVRQRGQGS